ncbi:MAG: DUF3822 family protein [Dysgonamonadaceae bacterium]
MFFPDSIDLSETEKYILALRIQADSFSFAIRNPEVSNGYVYRQTAFNPDTSYIQQVQKTIFDLSFLTQSFKQIWVEMVSTRFSLVPEEFYDTKHREYYLEKTLHGDTGYVVSERLETEQTRILFDMDKEVYEFLSRNLSSPTFTHHISSLAKICNSHPGKTELFSKMFLYFHDGQMDVVVIRNGKTLFAQSFTDKKNANLFYHTMNIWKACEMNQLNDRLFLMGDMQAYGELQPLFCKYIQFVNAKGIPSEAFLLGQDAQQTPFDLFGILL